MGFWSLFGEVMGLHPMIGKATAAAITALTLCMPANAAQAGSQAGPMATSHFRIPADDARVYHTDVNDGILSINPRNTTILNPDGARAGRHLPESAWVRPTPMDTKLYTTPGKNRFCSNRVANDVRHNYPDQGQRYFFESSMAPAVTNRNEYHFFVSLDERWVARCSLLAGTCIALISGTKWTARLNIFDDDLCNVPNMADRLSALVDRWMK